MAARRRMNQHSSLTPIDRRRLAGLLLLRRRSYVVAKAIACAVTIRWCKALGGRAFVPDGAPRASAERVDGVIAAAEAEAAATPPKVRRSRVTGATTVGVGGLP